MYEYYTTDCTAAKDDMHVVIVTDSKRTVFRAALGVFKEFRVTHLHVMQPVLTLGLHFL